MNGWLLVRIAGIVVGIATLLRVATNEGIVTYDPLFQAWMDRLRDIVELGFLTDLIKPGLDRGIELVRSLGISVPALQDEWRPAYVLSMLVFGAAWRHNGGGLFWFAAAIVASLAIAAWAGLTGSVDPAAAAGAAVIGAVIYVPILASRRALSASDTFHARFAIFVGAILTIIGLQFLAPESGVAWAYAVIAAILTVSEGISGNWRGGFRAVFASRQFNTGIDILFTMSLAFVIAVAVANPPIW
jgi:hypothetical protein